VHRGDDFIQKLAGTADEGFSLQILITAGSFAYEHEACPGVSDAEHNMAALFAKAATPALTDLGADFAQANLWILARKWRGNFFGRGVA
jgi:hypothetical protein